MRHHRLWVGIVALSAVAFGGAVATAVRPTALAENQDVRETKMVKLKLPAMV
jgi:hypothetical protein